MAAKKTATQAKTAAKKTTTKVATKGKATTTATSNGTTGAKKATKTSAAKKPATQKTAAKKTATKATTPAPTKAAKKPAKKSAAKKKTGAGTTTAAKAARLVVREDESPWTPAELKEVRSDLEAEITRLRAEIEASETELTAFLKEPVDGAGDDQADAGAKSFEREHELSLVAGARTGLEQNLHAVERLDDGTYGICESCGNPVGKLRLQAYPRATLCMSCKSKQERR